jgi:hydroxypyruvate isomerase
MGCPQVNCLAGIAPAGADPAQLRQTCVDNLRFAARQLGEHGIRLVIEPIDTRDIPGFFLCGTQQAVDLIRDTESNNIALQNHVCHIQIMEDDLAPTIQRHPADIRPYPARRQPRAARTGYG